MSTNPFHSGYEPARGIPTRTVGLRIGLLMAVAGVLTCDGTAGPENQAPQAAGRIPDQVVQVDSTAVLELRADFSDPEGDTLTYAASSGAPATATVTVSGSALSVTGLAAGEAMVTVTARDPDGLAATQSFAVNVTNRAPVVVDTIPDAEVFVDSSLVFDAAVYFADPDGDELTYTAVSSDTTRATAAVSGSMVTVTGMAVGSTTVTVTARDPGGLEVAQSFSVTVPNQAPVAVGTISNRSVGVGNSVSVEVESYFTDPDNDDLTYTATSDSTTLVTVTVSGSSVELTGVAAGQTTVTVRATDPGNLSAIQHFTVTVAEGNLPPMVDVPIADFNAVPDGVVYIFTLTEYFYDPNGDALTWSVSSSNTNVASPKILVDTLDLTTGEAGRADIIVTATDPDGLSAADTFTVTVTTGVNQAPTVDVPIADFDAVPDGVVYIFTLTEYFSDPDGDDLTWSVSSSNTNVASPKILVDTLDLTTGEAGRADIIVTATDPDGLSAADTFTVTVTTGVNQAPTVDVPFADFDAVPDGVVYIFTLTEYFSDPDGDDLTWSVSSSNTNVASPKILVDTLDLTTGEAGRADIIVTATDPDGLSAADTFTVTVTTGVNQAPTVDVPFADFDAVPDGVVYIFTLTEYFSDPDGDDLTWSVSSSNTDVASPKILVDTLDLTTGGAGRADIIVTATDPDGLSAADTFTVTVTTGVNQAPTVDVPFADFDAVPDGVVYIFTLTEYFSDPNGDALTWSVSSSNSDVASPKILVDTLDLTTGGAGRADIIVTATDPDGLSAADTFTVTVTTGVNQAPTVDVPIADFNAVPDGVVYIFTLTEYFSDPDGDDLTWSVSSSNTDVASPKILVDTLDLTTGGAGRADIIVTATDPDGLSAADTFTVTVTTGVNQAPTVDVPFADFDAVPDGVVYIFTLTEYFSDPDGDDLTWSVSSSNTDVASPKILVDTLDLTTGGAGRADIIVTATDPDGLSAADTFTVTVTTGVNQAPTVDVPIADFNADPDGVVYIFTLTEYFSDPDGDDLTWSVSSSNTDVASPKILVDTLDLTTGGAGRADIIVTATDPDGLSAADTFTVTVIAVNRAPTVDTNFEDLDAGPSEVYSFTLTEYFSDPDGDDLIWAALTTNANVASLEIVADTLRVSTSPGWAEVAVIATDPDGLSASDNFRVSVTDTALTSILNGILQYRIPKKPIMRNARDRWEAALQPTELTNVIYTGTVTCGGYSSDSPAIDDHPALVGVANIDGHGGVLAQAGYCVSRARDQSPVLSMIRFDKDGIDRLSNSSLEALMLHLDLPRFHGRLVFGVDGV